MHRFWSEHPPASCLLVLALVLATPGLASGNEATAPSDPASRDALVREGLALRRARQDAAALEAFRRAFAAAPSATLRAQIALAEQALGRWLEAERDLVRALREPDAWVDANRSILTQALSVIQSHLASLAVTSNLPESQLWLNGERAGAVSETGPGAARRLTVGVHRLTLVAPDGRRLERTIQLKPGESYTYHAEWPALPELEPRRGAKQLSAPPRGVPPAEVPRSAGASTRRTFAYASAAVAVVALAEAVAASLLRLDYVQHYNGPSCFPQRSTQCAAYRDVANTLNTAALVGYAVAGSAALGSVTLFAWPERTFAASSAGLVFSGKF